MTVSTEVDHNEYTGNGVTTTFPYTFRIFQKSDLVVQVVDLNENITELILDTDYIVTGAGGYNGGNVILSKALVNGYQISISRELPVTQDTDLRNQGKFFAEVHEDAFDKLTMLIQQVRSWFALALRKPSTIANWYDALGNYIRNLRDPRDPQDAATKNYVDTISNNNYLHTLRVPESFTRQLPPAAERANMIHAYDYAGESIMVLPESGSAADVLLLLAQPDGLKRIGTKVNYGIPVGSTLTDGVTFSFDKDKGWLRIGGADLLPLDDEKNFWRGLPTPRNSWCNPALIGDYSVSFNRNGASFAVYTTTFGHDCVTYGVASIAGGAGSATGDPDQITSPNAEGYCSFAFGKNVIALGAKSAAFCEETEALSRAAFTTGYFTQARPGYTTDPGGVASDGIGAAAIGYRTRAAGDGSFAVGKNIQAYGGSIAIGCGTNEDNPAVNPHKDSVMLFAKSLIPGISVVPGGGGPEEPSRVGVHTKYPKEIVDVVLEGGGRAAIRIPGIGTGTILLQGTDNDGNALSIASLEWTSGNGGSAVGSLKINMNNDAPCIEFLEDGKVVLKNVKTLEEINDAPAGTIYKDASNFLKIVV
ncbi:hypothetical protein [Escherichia coli]|uniref:hypothetical protein n=1 Tax=Escherichia coli TaxID=562 RepID=UPI0010C276B8|nr:hypothetical protein [Escherichia coli]GCT38801.1 endo-alpha-sialidase [Escherichia coli]